MVLDRYIARTVIIGTFISMLVLLTMFAFIDFVAQLKAVGTGNYDALHAFLFVLLQLPQRTYELSPSILLLGGIISLGAIAANSELIIMRASGLSTNRITLSVLKAGFFIAILVALLGEYVVPYTTGAAKTLRAEAMDNKLIVSGYNNIWARNGNRYINVKKVMPNHQLQQISIYELDSQRHLSAMIYAASASYKHNSWILTGVRQTTIRGIGEPNVKPETRVSFKNKQVVPTLILPELFSVLELEAKDMSVQNLYTYSRYLEANHLDAGKYKLAFWIKIFTPITCLAMLLIAMPLVFSTTPRSGGLGQRIILAVVVGIVFFVVSRTMNYLGLAMGIEPVLSAGAPLVIIIIISLLFLRRVR